MKNKKFLIIDSRPFGLYSILLHTIDNIKWADDNGYIPVVRWGPGRWNPNFMRPGVAGNVKEKVNIGHPVSGAIDTTNFFDPAKEELFSGFAPKGFEETGYMGGIKKCLYATDVEENPWLHYFEPLNEYTVEDALAGEHLISDIFQVGNQQHSISIATDSQEVLNDFIITSLEDYNPLILHHMIRMCVGDDVLINLMKKHRRQVFNVLKRINIKKEIKKKVVDFKEENFTSDIMIGVHVRGTDKAGERHETVNFGLRLYLSELERNLKRAPNAKIFLATDSQEVVDLFTLLFSKEKIIIYPSYRMEKYNDSTPIPLSSHASPARGEEALIEGLLLSQCNFLIGSDSNMSMCPLYFNPTLKYSFVDTMNKLIVLDGQQIAKLAGL